MKPLGSRESRCNCIDWGQSLQDRDNRVCITAATVYRGERGPRRFGRKLDSGDGGERPRGAGSGAPLARGEGPRLSTEPECLSHPEPECLSHSLQFPGILFGT